ncbi:glycoside hydrolase, partial [bacterium]|nr:glycoside hydrolase [bacterium]
MIYDGEAVWVGSADGISKSLDEGKTWSRYTAATHNISGNFVTSLAYQEGTGTVWAATWKAEGANEYYAVSKSADGGATWSVHLTEDQIEAAIGRRTTP